MGKHDGIDRQFVKILEPLGLLTRDQEITEAGSEWELQILWGGAFEASWLVDGLQNGQDQAEALIAAVESEDMEIFLVHCYIGYVDHPDGGWITEPTGYGPYPRYRWNAGVDVDVDEQGPTLGPTRC